MKKDQKTRLIKIISRLIAQKTVNPPGNEYLLKNFVIELMKKIKMEVVVKEKKRGRTNIIGKIGKGKPRIALITHLDVVPAGKNWKTNPFKAVVKGGKIYGRGALDNKGPLAVCVEAIRLFLSKTPKPKGTLYLLAVADEEKGSELGMKWLLDQGFKVDFALIPDGGKIDEVLIGEKGLLWLKIISYGKQAHGSLPQLGINAIENLAELILEIKKIKWPKKQHSLFSGLTLNIGQIKGGEAPNIVPPQAEILIDIRYPLGIKKKEIVEKIKKAINKVKTRNKKAKFKLEIKEEKKPHLVNPDSPFIKAFLEAGKKQGIKMKLKTMGGITVAKEFYFHQIPAIAHYPTKKEVAHMNNEFVEIRLLERCVSLYALFLESIFSKR